MRLGKWTFALALMTATTGGAARAGEVLGVAMPDTMDVEGKTLALNGMGVRQKAFYDFSLDVNIYVAGLYLEQPSSDPAQIIASPGTKRVVMQFTNDVRRTTVTNSWNRAYRHNATVPHAQIAPQIAQLDAWMRDFKKGEVLSFTFLPGQGVEVAIDGNRLGVLPGDDFARETLGMWLGPRPPNHGIKEGLLGQHA
jgi:hypothetical protein